jgi:haloalkane dehalogenase
MIPVFVNEGFRVIAPDLLGCGKSDKPINKKDYSYQLHVDIITSLVSYLNLKAVTPFFQDWGGMIGLRVVATEPNRFSSVVAGNTGLPDASGLKGIFGGYLFNRRIKKRGKVTEKMFKERPSFTNWVAFSQTVENFHVAKIVQGGTVTRFSKEEFEAYNAPFPDDSYKAGVRIFPKLVPSQLRANHKAWKVLEKWSKPFLLTFSDQDPITKGQDKDFLRRIPKIQEHPIKGAGHFLQEDKGPEIAKIMIEFIQNNS